MSNITKEELIAFSDKISKLWGEAKIPYPVHFAGGNEDQLIEVFNKIDKDDFVFSTHRSHYHYLLKGGSKEKLEKMIFEGRSMHVIDKKLNFISSSIVSGCPAIASGVALGLKMKKDSRHVWCFIGDGGEDEGHFYEAVRYVNGFTLPCSFIIEDNDRSVETPKKDRYGLSQIDWPHCVTRYNYKATYPHVGLDKWIDFSGIKPVEYNLTRNNDQFFLYVNKKTDYKGNYKVALKESMENLAKQEDIIFLGYNINYGSMAYGTLSNVPIDKKIETPVAENLMVGLAIGLSIVGFRPVVYFERHDFVLNALDSIVNHLDKFEIMSHQEYKTPVILRAAIGSKMPLYPGPQHVGNYTDIFKKLVTFPVYQLKNAYEIINCYEYVKTINYPVMIIEDRELYSGGRII